MKYCKFLFILIIPFLILSCSKDSTEPGGSGSNNSGDSPFCGGDGSKGNPFQICSIESLQAINQDKYIDKYFIQTKDIDAAETKDWDDGKGFQPIGPTFSGTYDGQGYSIANLTIHRPNTDEVGLFRSTDLSISGGEAKEFEIKNVVLENVDIQGKTSVGGLVGASTRGTIINVHVSGRISTTHKERVDIGGLVGKDFGKVKASSAECTISINNNDSKAGNVGGLIGLNTGLVQKSYAKVKIVGPDRRLSVVGGLVGSNGGNNLKPGIIKECYAIGSISGGDRQIGGLAGYNFKECEISNSYARVQIEANESAGGIAGPSNGSITNCYATGKIKVLSVPSSNRIGALIGWNSKGREVSDSYWDKQTTGVTIGVAGYDDNVGNEVIGLTTTEMQGEAAKTNMSSLDFGNIWETVADDYPVLRWE